MLCYFSDPPPNLPCPDDQSLLWRYGLNHGIVEIGVNIGLGLLSIAFPILRVPNLIRWGLTEAGKSSEKCAEWPRSFDPVSWSIQPFSILVVL